MIATRATRGAISLSSSRYLPLIEASRLTKPVTLPPGLARLVTKPEPTGSTRLAKMIGTLRVCCMSNLVVGVPDDKMTSGRSSTSSFVNCCIRSTGRRPAEFDLDVLPLHPAELAQPLAECRNPGLNFRIALGIRHQHADPPHAFGLLRARRQRPRGSRSAEQRDELAPRHSITSSASARRVGGTVRPSVLAVLRLMTNSYFVGACTGKSPGFSPLKIRST